MGSGTIVSWNLSIDIIAMWFVSGDKSLKLWRQSFTISLERYIVQVPMVMEY